MLEHCFRLKFLARFLNEEYHVLWKDIFRYFIHNILNMKLREEIVYMSLENKYLYCIPVVYREMLQSLSAIKEFISFNYNVIDIYHQPLFCNSEILISGKTILWNDFITAGITQLKDICYEVKAGFLPDNAIVEMVTNVDEDISQDNIVKRYNALKCALPEKWTQTIQTKLYTRTEKIVIDINVNMNSKLVDF